MSTVKFNKLIEWIKDNGGSIHPNVIISENSKLKLSEKMGAPGVHLFTLPRKLCIDSGVYRNYKPPLYNELVEEELKIFHQPFFKLILSLISEKLKGRNSFYSQFISSLPQMEELIKTSPIFYYNDKKEQWKTVLPTVITKLDNLNAFYINLYLVIIKLKVFSNINVKMFPGYKSVDDIIKTIVLWAFLIVNNYALENTYLLPLFNLMHYNHETNNKLVMSETNINFSYESNDNLNLVINNGLLDNETLFTLHGYMNENSKQYLEIKLSNKYTIENEDVQDIIKVIFNKNFIRHNKKYYITSDTPSVTLVQYLRIISLNNRDLQLIQGDEDFYTKFISMDNEAGVYQKLLKIVQIKYSQVKKYNEIDNDLDDNDMKNLKKILKEQRYILKSMYYEIHKKWIGIMDTKYDEDKFKELFVLK